MGLGPWPESQAAHNPSKSLTAHRKGTHIVGDLLHLVLLHKKHFGDLLTRSLEDSGNQRVIGVLQLLFLWNHTHSQEQPGVRPEAFLTVRSGQLRGPDGPGHLEDVASYVRRLNCE